MDSCYYIIKQGDVFKKNIFLSLINLISYSEIKYFLENFDRYIKIELQTSSLLCI